MEPYYNFHMWSAFELKNLLRPVNDKHKEMGKFNLSYLD